MVAGSLLLLPKLQFRFSIGQTLRGNETQIEEVRNFYRTFPPSDGHLILTATSKETLTINHLRAAADWANKIAALPEVQSVVSADRILNLKMDGFTLDEWARLGGTGDEPLEFGDGPGMAVFKGNLVSRDLHSVALYLIKSKGTWNSTLQATIKRELTPPWEGAEVRMVGPNFLLREMGELLRTNFHSLIRTQVIALLLIIPLFMRSLRRAYLPLLCALSALAIYLSLFIIFDKPFDVMHLAGPGLILIIALADAIHLQQKFDDSRAAGKNIRDSLSCMFQTVGKACALTSLTTACGFISLLVARHEEIHDFGVWCAIGVLTAYVVVIVFVPVALCFFPGQASRDFRIKVPLAAGRFDRHRLAAPVTVLLVLLSAGIVNTRMDSSLERELPEDIKVVKDMNWFAEQFRGLDRIEIDLKADLRDPEVFALVETMQNDLRQFPGISGSRSYVDTIRMTLSPEVLETEDGPILGIQALGSGASFPFNLMNRKLSRACIVFYRNGDFGTEAYEKFRERVMGYTDQLPEGASLKLNGHLPMFYESTTLISKTLAISLICSLVMITLILIAVLRSFKLALLCLVPNAIPLLVVAGISGWLGEALHLGLMVVFSVGLGLAVDDTIHLMVRFKQLEKEKPKRSHRELMDEAVSTTGFSIVLTSMVLLVAALCYLGSSFSTMRWTGVTLGIVALTALVADLIVLPWLVEKFHRSSPFRKSAGATAVGVFLLAGVNVFGAQDEVTYCRDIAPIIQQKCIDCHREGAAAPFVLTDYASVTRRARTILRTIERGYMPPWHATGGDIPLLGDRRLTEVEISKIQQWVEDGKVEGDPADLPAKRTFPGGWRLGEPDLILTMKESYDLPANGPDIYRNFVIPTNVKKNRYIKAIEFRPSNPSVVHHALIFVDTSGRARELDKLDPEPGFSQMTAGGGTGRGVGGWVPGTMPRPLPEGLAHHVPKGSDIVLQTHFHLTGKAETERSTIGLYFGEAPKRSFTSIQLPPVFGAFSGIDIAPGSENTTIKDSFEIPVTVEAFGVQPHAHYRGKSLKLEATLPDGRNLVLLNIPEWDMDWQEEYRFAKPVNLPAGTRLSSTIAWDNSPASSNNPIVPPVRVRWGFESFDEMGSIDLFVVATGKQAGKSMKKLRTAYRDHVTWIAGNHVLQPDKLRIFGDLRQNAIARFDENGDGVLNDSERSRARVALTND